MIPRSTKLLRYVWSVFLTKELCRPYPPLIVSVLTPNVSL